MKLVKKILVPVLAAGAALAMAVVGLTGCGGISAPGNFTFDRASRAFSFDTSGDGLAYQITINKLINEQTGKSLSDTADRAHIQIEERGQTITQYASIASELTTMPGSSESAYVWSPIISSTLVEDTDGDGKVEGTIPIYRFQLQADGVTPVLLNGNPEELPLGHYYISCVASDSEGNVSEAAWQEFVVAGQLEAPDFSYSVENGKMTIALDSTYINNAMLYDGAPEAIDFTIDDGSGTTKTVTFNDWSYYPSVIGPTTTYVYMFTTKEIDVASTNAYTVSAVAKGDGGQITNSSTPVASGILIDDFNVNTADATSTFTGGGTTYTLTKVDATDDDPDDAVTPLLRWNISGGNLTGGMLEYRAEEVEFEMFGQTQIRTEYNLYLTTTSADGSASYNLQTQRTGSETAPEAFSVSVTGIAPV